MATVITSDRYLTSGITGKTGRVINVTRTGPSPFPREEPVFYSQTISQRRRRSLRELEPRTRNTEAIIAITILVIIVILIVAGSLFWYYAIRVPSQTITGGTVPGSCTTQSDCQANFVCQNGVCRGGVGASCSLGGCLSNLECKDGLCKKKVGDTCSSVDECSSGICDGGICKSALGEPCTDTGQCQTGTCVSGLCRAGLQTPCQTNSQCETDVCFGGVCLATLGQTCGANVDCLEPLECGITNQCVPVICAVPATCIAIDPDAQCLSNTCVLTVGSTGECIDDVQCNATNPFLTDRACGVLGYCGFRAGSFCTSGTLCASNGCIDNACTCSLDNHCNTGERCVNNQCVI